MKVSIKMTDKALMIFATVLKATLGMPENHPRIVNRRDYSLQYYILDDLCIKLWKRIPDAPKKLTLNFQMYQAHAFVLFFQANPFRFPKLDLELHTFITTLYNSLHQKTA